MAVTFSEPFPILVTDDVPRMVTFYRDRLGFVESYRFPTEGQPAFVVLRLGVAQLGFGTSDGASLHGRARAASAGNRIEICVYASNVDDAVTALRSAGALVLAEPADQPWGERAAYVADPDGNPILIVAPVEAGPAHATWD
jgi:lactoylglutathione lyase